MSCRRNPLERPDTNSGVWALPRCASSRQRTAAPRMLHSTAATAGASVVGWGRSLQQLPWSYLDHITPAWLLSGQQTHTSGSPRGCAGRDSARRACQLTFSAGRLAAVSQALRASSTCIIAAASRGARCHGNVLIWVFGVRCIAQRLFARCLPLSCIARQIAPHPRQPPKMDC